MKVERDLSMYFCLRLARLPRQCLICLSRVGEMDSPGIRLRKPMAVHGLGTNHGSGCDVMLAT